MKNSKSFFLAFLSAILLIFSFPPFNLWLLAWVAFIPLFYILQRKVTGREIFFFYFLSGLLFWLYHIWWLTHVTFLGYSLLVIYLALFFAFFGLALKVLKQKTSFPLLFLTPPLWVLFEFIRNHLFTGFPWSLLGYSQWENIPLIQIASITGVYGVSFLIIMVNAVVSDFLFCRGKKFRRNLVVSLLIIGSVVVVGEWILLKRENNGEKIRISVIQGNIPQDMKWVGGYEEKILHIYTNLSREAAEESNPFLIIWPETSYPGYLEKENLLYKKVEELQEEIKTPLLIGALNYENGNDYNSAFLISPQGEISKVYNKLHLVPFGEYIPLKKIFSFLKRMTPEIGDYNKGEEYTIFEITNYQLPITNKFAVLICFEDLFPELARRFTQKGVDFLVVITNDAHYGDSPCPWQHFVHSVFRAVENRVWVVRAANTGVSGFIDSYGRVVNVVSEKEKATNIRGWSTEEVEDSSSKTFYNRWGDIFIYFNLLYCFTLVIGVSRKKLQNNLW